MAPRFVVYGMKPLFWRIEYAGHYLQQSIGDVSQRIQYVNNITRTSFQYATNYAGSQNGLRYVAYTFDDKNSAVTYGFN